MIRGTTPKHIFTVPFDVNNLSKVRVIYAQDYNVIFTKTEADCVLEGNSISVTLKQEDTFKFDHKKSVQIQLRVLTVAKEVLSSTVQTVGISKCLEEEVLL